MTGPATGAGPTGGADHLLVTGLGIDGRGLLRVEKKPGVCVVKDKQPVSLAMGAGKAQAVVFSPDKAMGLASLKWTTQIDDHEIQLSPLLTVKVKIWIARKDAGVSVLAQAGHELKRAREIFRSTGSGLTFDGPIETTKKNLVVDYHAVCWKDISQAGTPLKASLNVYYVCGAGKGCIKTKDGSVLIFIYPDADPETLAHELGHAVGLGDQGYNSLSPRNVMGPNVSSGRNHLTLGQAYWANLAKKSAVRRFGLRPAGEKAGATPPTLGLDEDRPWLTGHGALSAGGPAAPELLATWLDGGPDQASPYLETIVETRGAFVQRLGTVLRHGRLQRADINRYRRHLKRTCTSLGLVEMYLGRFVRQRQARAAMALAELARAGIVSAERKLDNAVRWWARRPDRCSPEIVSLVGNLLEDLRREAAAPHRRRAPGSARARVRRLFRLQSAVRVLLAAQGPARVPAVGRRRRGR